MDDFNKLLFRLGDEKCCDLINILGLSNVFEDFELNTAANTQKLLQSGEMVGVTQQYFQEKQIERYAIPLKFAISFDRETFHLNFFPGTPSWVLFDQDCNILSSWFGPRSEEEVESMLSPYFENAVSIQ